MRCAVYARVSTEMETQKTSIAHQISYFENYIKDKSWELVNVYQDVESGTSMKKREGLQKLRKDGASGLFDIVLIKSISRFARNTLEGLQLARDFKEKNIRLITIEDGFDSKEYDEFMFTLLLSIAQKESEKMSQRIQFGKHCRAKNGRYNGSTPPYGYERIDKCRLVPANDLSKYIVQKIFQMYIEGNGLYKIAKELNEKAYPTPSQVAGKSNYSNIWHQSTLRKILSNSIYVGDMEQNKTTTRNVLTGERRCNKNEDYIYVGNTHEGIIDRIVFDEVQNSLLKKKVERHGIQSRQFSNLLVCGSCGSGLHFKKSGNTYICGKMNKMGKQACFGATIQENSLLELVQKQFEALIKNFSNNTVLKNNLIGGVGDCRKSNEINELEGLIQSNSRKMNRVLDIYMENNIDKETFLKKKKELENQCEILTFRLKKMMQQDEESLATCEEIIAELLEPQKMDTLLLHKLIQKIIISNEKKVEIFFDFTLS